LCKQSNLKTAVQTAKYAKLEILAVSKPNSPLNLSVQIGKLKLQNPVMVASGTFGYGVEYSELLDLNQLGAVVVKGIRLGPVRGNRTPRTVEVTSGLINAIGLQGPGVDGFIKKYWPFLKGLKVPTIINIWGTTVEEYAEVARRFDALGGVGALELNVSCPNIKEGGAQFGTDVKLLSQVVSACRKATSLPLITKMSPNVVSIAPYAKAAEDAGSDALSIMNSYPAMAIDVETSLPRLANVTGGLTGPCIKPIAIKLVWEASKAVKIPVIGMGGIQSAVDAIEFMMAGATAVAVGTANFYEPQTVVTVIAGIREFLEKHGLQDVRDLIGSVRVAEASNSKGRVR
jgi:dihydroorotate dehydrogenase (NAD+) catalytic subunit